jgi:hypothetical protein
VMTSRWPLFPAKAWIPFQNRNPPSRKSPMPSPGKMNAQDHDHGCGLRKVVDHLIADPNPHSASSKWIRSARLLPSRDVYATQGLCRHGSSALHEAVTFDLSPECVPKRTRPPTTLNFIVHALTRRAGINALSVSQIDRADGNPFHR